MEKGLIEIDKCKVSKTGLKLDENLSFDEWKGIGLQLQLMHGSVGWWIGDWLNFGEKHYGETYAQAVEATGLEVQTLMNYKAVAKGVKLPTRVDSLSYSAHREVAFLEPEQQKEILVKAVEQNLNSREITGLVKEIKKLPTPPLPENKYDLIYCDPPWAYDVDLSSGATRSPENNYPVMELDELCNFGEKVKEISADDCILFMWITAPKLNWMNDVLEAWGFTYRTNLIWDKVKPNLGHYASARHEIIIIAGKGKCSPRCDGTTIQSIDSVQSIEKSARHSEKPEEFRKIIETLYPDSKKIELFGRKKAEGWMVWGNDKSLTNDQ